MHDKAFEMGLFTLDQQCRIFVNPKEAHSISHVVQTISAHHGEQIRLSDVKPLDDALLEHWIRVGVEP
jgi:predicted restriction endonuclease